MAYRKLLDEQPGYAATDAVLYQLARALEFTGDPAGALAVLDRLVARYPHGAYVAEAQFRRGEAFFSAQHYADAERAYAAVLAADAQIGFCRSRPATSSRGHFFKQGRDEESSAAFLVLLDTLLVEPGQPPATRHPVEGTARTRG